MLTKWTMIDCYFKQSHMLVHVYLYSMKATLSACFKNNYVSSTEILLSL